ncbi:hypothetical protein Tdes44962_MAKER09779 [Teratosphaeria destructans]|uniref:Uncharacterized protein n=1 Tax=Teratosphaeria destructans TaxID=418781 RepID=A0A9W7SR63_9PEZI|nr:hypothetical protein Tdes44962_MAKER09779 [Teratosphaeria destructans]
MFDKKKGIIVRQLDAKYILLSATFIKNTAKDINGILKFVYKYCRISRFAEAFINTNLDAIKRSNLLFTVEDNKDETRFYGPNNVLLADEVHKIRHGRISGFTKIWLDTLEAINHRMPTDRGAIAFYICANAAKYAACAHILADIVTYRSNKQYLADLVRTDYANAIIHIIKDIAKQTLTALGYIKEAIKLSKFLLNRRIASDNVEGTSFTFKATTGLDLSLDYWMRTHPSKPQNEPKETAVDQTNANKLRYKVYRAVDVLCGPNINKYLLTAVLDAHKAKTNNKRPKVDTKKDLLRTYLEERYNADPNFKMDISRAELYNKAFLVDLYALFLGFDYATEAN